MTLRSLSLLLLAAACAPGASTDATDTDDGVDGGPTAPPAEPEVALASTLGFVRAAAGLSDGFDLDESSTTGEDPCGRPDYAAPDGRQGIDNAFAALLPIIESTGGQALKDLVQDAVDSGELLLLFEITGLEGASPGDPVGVRIVRGMGRPTIGGNGLILPSQTFDADPDLPAATVADATLQEDGSILGSGYDLRLPLAVFDESIDLTVHQGRLHLVPTETGWRGLVGGGIETQEVADNVLGFDAIPDSLVNAIIGALSIIGDLPAGDDGACDRMSVAMAFEAVPAFLFADELGSDDTPAP